MNNNNIQPPRPAFVFAIVEFIVVFAILSFQFAFLLPAVNYARERQGQAIVFASLAPWYEAHPWLFVAAFTVTSTLTLTLLMVGIRAILPNSAKAYMPWRPMPRKKPLALPKRKSAIPAIWSAVMAVTGTALLIFATLHVQVDRSNRRPIVTWEGPFADEVAYVALVAWLLSLAAALIAIHVLQRYESRSNVLAGLAIFFSSANFLGSLIFWAVVYED